MFSFSFLQGITIVSKSFIGINNKPPSLNEGHCINILLLNATKC